MIAALSASLRSLALVVAVIVLGACAANKHYDEANRLIAAGRPEAAIAELERAVKQEPRNAQYRSTLLRERNRVATMRLVEGDSLAREEKFDEAEVAYRAALAAEPDNQRVPVRLAELAKARQSRVLLQEARDAFKANKLPDAETRLRTLLQNTPNYPGARDLLRRVTEAASIVPPPSLKAPFAKPITLEFRDAAMRTVFDMLSRTSGINFVFDRDVRQDTKLTVFVRNVTLEDALKLILTTNQLDHKVLNENSVLVYPNTPAKQKDYRELVVRSYYIANADVKQAAALVKSIVKTQDVFIDEKLNLMVVKDTPDVIRLTDQLVRTLDVADPEVMLDVEVMEVARTRAENLGIQFPGSVSLGARSATTTGAAATTTTIDAPMFFTTSNPAVVFNLRATVGSTNLLANPRIRVKNKEKAKIHIGDKVPVFTSTAANLTVATSVSYLDVGLKLDVEPQIYLNDDVQIKVALEVSNIVERVEVGSSTSPTVAFRIGTRNANTVLQLRDGETQILAGLINDEDRRSSTRIPGLGDIPMLSKIFGSSTDTKVKNEIVLLITPRIVRNINRPEGLDAEMAVGTDTAPGMPPLRIARTAPGSLAVSPAGTSGAGLGDAPPPPAANVPVELNAALRLQVPAQARVGAEVVVRLQAPGGLELKDGFVELTFDPAALAPVGFAAPVPGRVQIDSSTVANGAELRFKVLGDKAGTTQVAVSNIELVDASGFAVGMMAPPPAQIAIVK